jgi:hypothetical protein
VVAEADRGGERGFVESESSGRARGMLFLRRWWWYVVGGAGQDRSEGPVTACSGGWSGNEGGVELECARARESSGVKKQESRTVKGSV